MFNFGNVNKVMLVGSLGRTPILKETAKGTKYCHLSVATNRRVKTAEDTFEDETTWHKATAWSHTAEMCVKHLTVGTRVYLEGELRSHTWKGADEKERTTMEVNVEKVSYLAKSRGSENAESVSEVALATPVSF